MLLKQQVNKIKLYSSIFKTAITHPLNIHFARILSTKATIKGFIKLARGRQRWLSAATPSQEMIDVQTANDFLPFLIL